VGYFPLECVFLAFVVNVRLIFHPGVPQTIRLKESPHSFNFAFSPVLYSPNLEADRNVYGGLNEASCLSSILRWIQGQNKLKTFRLYIHIYSIYLFIGFTKNVKNRRVGYYIFIKIIQYIFRPISFLSSNLMICLLTKNIEQNENRYLLKVN